MTGDMNGTCASCARFGLRVFAIDGTTAALCRDCIGIAIRGEPRRTTLGGLEREMAIGHAFHFYPDPLCALCRVGTA